MSLDSLVAVSIVAKSKGLSRAGFGVPLVAHYHTKWPERVRAYDSQQGMLDDGFAAGDAAVRAVGTILAQIPNVAKVKVGRMATAAVAHVETLVPTAVSLNKYILTLADNDGVLTDYTFTADATATVAEICAAFVSAVNGDTGITVTASGGVTELVLTGDVAGEVFYCRAWDQAANGHNWKRTCTNADPGIATDLAAINGADADWYGLIVTNPARACQSAAAVWAETNRKLLGITSGDTDVRDTIAPNIAKDVKDAAQAHTYVLYSDRPQEFGAAGIMGQSFPLDPGSRTWAHKTVANVSSVELSATHVGNIEALNANWYRNVAGANIFFPSKTGSGEYIDITHGIDWLKARVQEELFLLLLNNEKIPFTDQGAIAIEAAIRGPLQVAANNNFIKPDFVITVPRPSALTAADKAARTWTGITFSAVLTGATHKMTIKGTLTL